MSMTISVDPAVLAQTADALAGLVVPMRTLHSRLAGADVLRDPWVGDGMAQFTAAYSVVATLVGDDLGLVARRVDVAAVTYDLTEIAIAEACPA
jgi:hypothetical protein